MRTVAVVNQKGGVGKTTTAIHLAAGAAEAGRRVLLVDLDPQANATSGLGLETIPGKSLYPVLLGQARAVEMLQPARQANLQVLTSELDLAGAEIELVPEMGREQRLSKALASLADQYDYVLIDCPPTLGLLTVNAMVAAREALVPIQCEYYALEGLSQLLNTVHLVQQGVNPALAIDGVLLTMYDGRLNLSRQVATDAREYFGAEVFEAVIPRNIRLAEAPSFGKPIILYDVASIGAQNYLQVAQELIARTRVG